MPKLIADPRPQNPSAAPRRPCGRVTWNAQLEHDVQRDRGDARDHERPRDGDVVLRHQHGEDVDRRRDVHSEERDRGDEDDGRQEQGGKLLEVAPADDAGAAAAQQPRGRKIVAAPAPR